MSLPGTVCFLLPGMVTLPLFFWLLYLGICPFMWSCVDLDLDSSSPCVFSEDLHGGFYNRLGTAVEMGGHPARWIGPSLGIQLDSHASIPFCS